MHASTVLLDWMLQSYIVGVSDAWPVDMEVMWSSQSTRWQKGPLMLIQYNFLLRPKNKSQGGRGIWIERSQLNQSKLCQLCTSSVSFPSMSMGFIMTMPLQVASQFFNQSIYIYADHILTDFKLTVLSNFQHLICNLAKVWSALWALCFFQCHCKIQSLINDGKCPMEAPHVLAFICHNLQSAPGHQSSPTTLDACGYWV
jgi:hypothetical protein